MANIDPFAKVSVGDPFRFKALVHNAVIDLINERRIPGLGGGRRIPGYHENETAILVKNKTGEDLPQFGVVKIATPSILQSANDQAFRSRHFWDGETPSSTDTIAITQEPIAKGNTGTETDGRIGPAILLGQTPAKVNVTDSAHKFCVPSTSTSTLDSAATGPIKLLWYDASGGSTGNNKWAKVLLLNSTPGAGGSITYAAMWRSSGNYSIANNTVTIPDWDNTLVDTGSFADLTNNRFSVSAGDYEIGCEILFFDDFFGSSSGNAPSVNLETRVTFVNGAGNIIGQSNIYTYANTIIPTHHNVYFNHFAGSDTVTLKVYQQNGSAVAMHITSSGYSPRFWIKKLG